MIRTGVVIGRQSYSFTPDGSNRHYDGLRLCICYDVGTSSEPDAVVPGDGQFADMVSISFRDLGAYVPVVGDNVRYHTYRENNKLKCGFVLPL